MDTTPSQSCPVCGGGRLPDAAATSCPNGGPSVPAEVGLPPRDRLVLVGSIAVVATPLLLLGVGLVLVLVAGSKRPGHAAAAAAGASGPPPTVTRASPPPPPPPVRSVPAIAPTVMAQVPDLIPPQPPEPATLPARPGDTDLSADPLAAYAGGPPADRLTIHGLRVGLPASDVPPAMLAQAAPDHLRDVAGDLCAVDDGRITEVHVRDPDVLARMPMDSQNAMFARFGPAADGYDDGDGRTVFRYPARGLHVCWDFRADRLVEVVLCRPTAR